VDRPIIYKAKGEHNRTLTMMIVILPLALFNVRDSCGK
jgi:hypothetical protein